MRNSGKRYSPAGLGQAGKSAADHIVDPKGAERKESVEAKWEQLQYYESNQWQQEPAAAAGFGASLAGSSTRSSSSTSSGVSSRCSADSDAATNGRRSRFQQMKQQSLKKLSSIRFQIANLASSGRQRQRQNAQPIGGFSTAPDGGGLKSGGVIPRIRASKSMQNLEQITRDSIYNLRDATSNIKQRYNSRLELRQAQPSAQYGELWDEDNSLDSDDGEEGGGHTYDRLRKTNQRRKYLEFVGL